MSKKKKSNGYGEGTFVKTTLFLSKAFLNLGVKGTSPVVSHSSHKILMMFLGKRRFSSIKVKKKVKQVPSDDNRFTMTYKELSTHGLSQKVSTRGFDELLAKGFIKIIDPGGSFEKHKAVYALVETYLSWDTTQQQVFYRRERDIKRGYQGNRKKQLSRTLAGDTHTDAGGGHPPHKTRTLAGDTP